MLKLRLRSLPATDLLPEFPAHVPESVLATYDADDPPAGQGLQETSGATPLALRRTSKLIKSQDPSQELATNQNNPAQFMSCFLKFMASMQGGVAEEIPSLQIFAPKSKAPKALPNTAADNPAPPSSQAALPTLPASTSLASTSTSPTPQSTTAPSDSDSQEKTLLSLPPALPAMDPAEQAAMVTQALKEREAAKKADKKTAPASKAKAKAKGKAKAKAKGQAKAAPVAKTHAKASQPPRRQTKKNRTITDLTVDGRFIPACVRKKRFATGCGKCRYVAGCTPSCFRGRTL